MTRPQEMVAKDLTTALMAGSSELTLEDFNSFI